MKISNAHGKCNTKHNTLSMKKLHPSPSENSDEKFLYETFNQYLQHRHIFSIFVKLKNVCYENKNPLSFSLWPRSLISY